MNQVITRFAPSPTGDMHFGNALIAFTNAIFAMKHRQDVFPGEFHVRYEDTDRERYVAESIRNNSNILTWLGLKWDGDIIFQSERNVIYSKYYDQLLANNLAYRCFCTKTELAAEKALQIAAKKPPKYSGKCKHLSQNEINEKIAENCPYVLRFKVPNNEIIAFNDLIHGEQTTNTNFIGDFIIKKSNGETSFIFCNAIDDALTKITHVFRGSDHVTNTYRQCMILKSLSLNIPTYAHMPSITSDGSIPLSKRNGAKSILELKNAGYLSKAIINTLAKMINPYDNKLMELKDIANTFQVSKIGKSSIKFDEKHLQKCQEMAVSSASFSEFYDWAKPAFAFVPKDKHILFYTIIKSNTIFPIDAEFYAKIFFQKDIQYSAEILDKMNQIEILKAKDFISDLKAIIMSNELCDNFDQSMEVLSKHFKTNKKTILLPLRLIFTGISYGPHLSDVVKCMDKEILLERLTKVDNAKNL